MALTYTFTVGQTQSMYGISVTLLGFSTEENYANVKVNGIQYTLWADTWQLANNLKLFITGLDDPSQTARIMAEQITLPPPAEPPPTEQKYKLVFQFSGALPTALGNAAIEILHIMSDIIAKMTGGYVGTPYYEGSDKIVFMVGTMGAGGIEGFIASSPKFISIVKWFAGLLGLVYVSSYIAEVSTGITTAITTTVTDATIDKCLSSNLTEEAKADCVRRALDLGKPTDWKTIVMMLGGLAIAAFFLKDVIGGKK